MLNKQAIVVLGGGLIKDKNGVWRTCNFNDPGDKDGITGDRLRVVGANFLYQDDPENIVISASYKGKFINDDGYPPIAEVLAKELIELGVPEDKIIEEKKSNNTYENLIEVGKILGELNINSIRIVTNRWHAGRVKAMLEYNQKINNLYKNVQVEVIEGETVAIEHDPEAWKKIVEEAYSSKAMAKRMELENIGIKQIKNGTYQFEFKL